MATKYISIREFCNRGYLQEVNRRFLHRLGLALEVSVDDSSGTEVYALSGVRDAREDPEGYVFGPRSFDSRSLERATLVENELAAKQAARVKLLGADIQPIIISPDTED